ncbi:MAG: hypothetical protein E7678_08025, partial [Ruminococcaceae bacterium]|nr:hypothetical protein [Oscillospiraceae bacterium]
MKRKIIFVSLLSIIFAAVVIIVVLAIKNPTPPGCIYSVPSNATAYYGADKFLSCARVKPIGIYDGDFYDYKAAKDSEGAKEADKNSNGGNSKTKYIIVKCEIITDYYKLLCDGETVNFAFYLGNTKEFDQNKYDDFIKLINESDSLVIFSHGKDTEKQLYSSVAGENVRFENISAVPISDSHSTIRLFPIADESVNFNGLFSIVPGLEEKLSFTEDIKNYFFKGMSEDELEESVNTLYELSISAPKNNKAPRTIHGLRPDIYYRKMTGEELSVDDLLKKGDSTSFLKVKLINRYDGYYSPKSKTAISSDDVCRVMECEVIEDCYDR